MKYIVDVLFLNTPDRHIYVNLVSIRASGLGGDTIYICLLYHSKVKTFFSCTVIFILEILMDSHKKPILHRLFSKKIFCLFFFTTHLGYLENSEEECRKKSLDILVSS